MIADAQRAGLTAGASTPDSLIDEFVTRLKACAESRESQSTKRGV
jgi:4-hydroxy-3-methylbut-2-enyl diphosphate reductase IspH